ncbi:MAG: preprotein translocase subunit SecG [Bacteroidota bacterium]
MFTLLMSLEIFICLLLIVVILMQSSKGGGLAGTFGGGNVGMVFGVRRTADFLIRATQVLAALFIVLSLVINVFFLPSRATGEIESVLQRGATQRTATTPQLPPVEAPATPPVSAPATPNQ